LLPKPAFNIMGKIKNTLEKAKAQCLLAFPQKTPLQNIAFSLHKLANTLHIMAKPWHIMAKTWHTIAQHPQRFGISFVSLLIEPGLEGLERSLG
jgi:hypothetical protein